MKRKAWELLAIALDEVDHDEDCEVLGTGEDRGPCTCWVEEATALVKRRKKKGTEAAVCAAQEEDIWRARIQTRLQALDEAFPPELAWPTPSVRGPYWIRASRQGRPQGGRIPKDPLDERMYTSMSLFPEGRCLGECWTLYEGFPCPQDPTWGRLTLPPNLSWATLEALILDYTKDVRSFLQDQIARRGSWVTAQLKLLSLINTWSQDAEDRRRSGT